MIFSRNFRDFILRGVRSSDIDDLTSGSSSETSLRFALIILITIFLFFQWTKFPYVITFFAWPETHHVFVACSARNALVFFVTFSNEIA